jgi:2-iminobutanoate/2-iminopropanoate deaminase
VGCDGARPLTEENEMAIKRGNPDNLANVRSNIYHHYIRVDNPKSLIFLSGQLSRDSQGKLVGPGDMAEQTRQAIRNMRTVLESAGGTLDDIVSIVVYTTDMREFKNIVAARMEFFKNKLPTSTIVEVNHLADPGLLIEFQAIAALSE